MNLKDEWAANEERLAREADSLAELLEGLRGRIPPVLIGGREWQRLLELARELPAAMACYPFGFELPLHERRPAADLGVSVVGGTGPAAFFEQRAGSHSSDSYAGGIARLLSETDHEESPLRQVIGRKMMLEYDIDSMSSGSRPDPGIFLRPAEQSIFGGEGRRGIEAIGVVLDALVAAVGWEPDPAEVRQTERIYLALEPEAKIESFGAFPSRERALRIAVTGFRNASGLMAFLDRAGWSGPHSVAAGMLSRFEERGAFVNLVANLDVFPEGIGPTLGLGILAKKREPKDPRYWVDKPGQWTAFVDTLREEGLTVPEKLAALADWSQEPATLYGKSGPFILMRGIHHVKLVLAGDRFEKVKAYVFMLVLGSMPASFMSDQ